VEVRNIHVLLIKIYWKREKVLRAKAAIRISEKFHQQRQAANEQQFSIVNRLNSQCQSRLEKKHNSNRISKQLRSLNDHEFSCDRKKSLILWIFTFSRLRSNVN
jgi:hypothetical protein